MKTKPASLIIGCHHGRECIASESVYYQMNYLLKNYSTNEQIGTWIDQSAILVVPMLNPDGHDIVIRRNGNRSNISAIRTFEKKFRTELQGKNLEAAKDCLNKVVALYDKAAKKGVLHKNRANRKKSRLTIAYNKTI